MTKQSNFLATAQDAAVKARNARLDAGLSAFRTPGEILAEKPHSMRAAINAKCWDCVGGGEDAGWQWSIGNCTDTECGLLNFRPYQHKLGQEPEGIYK